jgi:ABC-type transporter Mla subunit MlaD
VKPIKLRVAGVGDMVRSLHRIEQLLEANLEQREQMADTLDDVRSNLQDLGVDVDTAITEIGRLRTDLESALANAGVDETARAEIMGLIDSTQQRLSDALNPAVPVDPGVEPAEPLPPAEGGEGTPTG